MKVLFLGNSNDTGTWVKAEEKRQVFLEKKLSDHFGVPVEIVVRNCWPNEGLPRYIERCLAELQPDMVYLNINTFAFTYESTPLRLKRVLGRLGEPVGNAGFRLAESRRWSHNAVFRQLRALAQATIGGDTHVTTAEAVERYTETVRQLVRHEGLAVVVKGPFGKSKKGLTGRERVRREFRRREVHQALKALCSQLHIPYYGADTPQWQTNPRPKGLKAGDGTHSNAAGHRVSAEDHFPYLRDTWTAHLGESLQPATAPPP